MLKSSALQLSALVGILASITLATRALLTFSEPPTMLQIPVSEIKTDWVYLPMDDWRVSFSTGIYPAPGDTDVWVTIGTRHAVGPGQYAPMLNAARYTDSDSFMPAMTNSASKPVIFALDCRH